MSEYTFVIVDPVDPQKVLDALARILAEADSCEAERVDA